MVQGTAAKDCIARLEGELHRQRQMSPSSSPFYFLFLFVRSVLMRVVNMREKYLSIPPFESG